MRASVNWTVQLDSKWRKSNNTSLTDSTNKEGAGAIILPLPREHVKQWETRSSAWVEPMVVGWSVGAIHRCNDVSRSWRVKRKAMTICSWAGWPVESTPLRQSVGSTDTTAFLLAVGATGRWSYWAIYMDHPRLFESAGIEKSHTHPEEHHQATWMPFEHILRS